MKSFDEIRGFGIYENKRVPLESPMVEEANPKLKSI